MSFRALRDASGRVLIRACEQKRFTEYSKDNVDNLSAELRYLKTSFGC